MITGAVFTVIVALNQFGFFDAGDQHPITRYMASKIPHHEQILRENLDRIETVKEQAATYRLSKSARQDTFKPTRNPGCACFMQICTLLTSRQGHCSWISSWCCSGTSNRGRKYKIHTTAQRITLTVIMKYTLLLLDSRYSELFSIHPSPFYLAGSPFPVNIKGIDFSKNSMQYVLWPT